MNRTRLLLIGFVALALGAFVAFAVYKNVLAKSGANNEPGIDVALAASDLKVGDRLEERDIRVARVPVSLIPPGAFRAGAPISGRGIVLPVSKGEIILSSKLAPEKAGSGLPSMIPPGMRAVSVRVNEVVAVAGFVVPGTRVDVLLTGSSAGNTEPQTLTVLENVFVIAAGQKLERNASGDPQSTPVITLLVSPDDAQKLTLASSQGKIQLVLRNPVDTKPTDPAPLRANGLYKNLPAPTVAVHPKAAPRKIAQAAPPPEAYKVQIIRGNKVDETKFPEQDQSGAH